MQRVLTGSHLRVVRIGIDDQAAAAAEWVEAIAAWLIVLKAGGRPATTLRLRRYQLQRAAAGLAPTGPWQVTGEQLVAWVGSQGWGRDTLRSWRSALRGFYGWAVDTGRVRVNPALALPSVKPTPPVPRPAPEDVYRAALAGADDRLRLMVRLAAELGMRRGEVAVAHRTDLLRELDGWALLVHGKGGKLRTLPVDDGLAAAIRRAGDGFLFPGRIDGHLSPHYVGKLVARAMPGAWTMHTLRHRFATVGYAIENDLIAMQELLGHASIETTRRYVLRPREAQRRVVAAVARVS